MASLSPSWLFQDQSVGNVSSFDYAISGKPCCRNFQTPFVGAYNPKKLSSQKSDKQFHVIKCTKNDRKFDPSSIEPPPYYSYMDSTSGKLEPACGARASIPGREYWPEGTANRVAAARAPEPVGKSDGKPSYGKNPGSRRRKYKGLATASEAAEGSSEAAEIRTDTSEQPVLGNSETDVSVDEPKDPSEEYVIYQTEQEENLTPYELDKAMGRPHPFVDPSKPPVGEPRSSEDLWWNWRKKENEFWSRWKKRAPDVDTVFAKAMAETGQIKLHGDHPTKAESLLAKTRRHIFKVERLQAEQRRLKEIGPIAYYSEWVKAWDRDTSREVIQKHYEETGEDENIQLITMFEHQTAEEYRIMMGTDVRIKRDPLAIRMREDLIKEIWGGDPVYPTINYIQDPDEVIDYRGPDFHEPTPSPLAYLMEEGEIISRQELEKILTKDKKQEIELQVNDMDDAMASAVDIGDDDAGRESDEEEGDEEGGGGEGEGDGEGEDEKITRNWSVMKTTPQLHKSKEKPKKAGPMSLEEAVDDSENLTDFLMDFDEEE